MKEPVKPGTVGEETFVVEEKHLIDFVNDGMPEILCTPWLVWFLEHAARNAVLPHFEPGESSVGVVVNVQHLAATPLGEKVVCRARVLSVDGNEVSFQLPEAHDEHEQIARGIPTNSASSKPPASRRRSKPRSATAHPVDPARPMGDAC